MNPDFWDQGHGNRGFREVSNLNWTPAVRGWNAPPVSADTIL